MEYLIHTFFWVRGRTCPINLSGTGRGIGQVRFQVLTWDKAERPDMSGYCFCNLVIGPDKSSWNLVSEKLELGRTCPTIVSRIRLRGRICPDRDLAAEEEVRHGHVRARGRASLKNLSGIRSVNWICPAFLGILVGR
jgi:hypothetical protein